MADKTILLTNANIPLKMVDNGDGTYSFSSTLGASASIDIGDVTLLAGEAHIGEVGGASVNPRATPTLTVHATYAANDYVGTSGVAMVFADAARIVNGKGWIIGARLIDYALQSVSCELWLFDTAITPPDDSAAWTLTDAHAARLICVIPFNTYYASALNSVTPGAPIAPALFQTLAASKDIYGCLVTRGAPAYASGDLTVVLDIMQD